MFNKKIIYFLLLTSFLFPKSGFCIKGRDMAMIASGTLVCAGGITFAIKSGKKSKAQKDQVNQIIIQPWFPMKDVPLYDFKKIP